MQKIKELLVVIQGEAGNEYDPEGNLLFDFTNTSFRPREIYTYANGNPVNVGSNNDRQTSWDGCSGPGNYDASMFSGTPCGSEYEPFMTFLDLCHNTHEAIHEPYSGNTPLGCDVSYSPLTLHWDNSWGCIELNTDGFPIKPTEEYYVLTTPPDPRKAAAAAWGWDEAAWWILGFKGGIGDNGDQCRATWLAQAMETVRSTYPNPNTFFPMPGIIYKPLCCEGDPACEDYQMGNPKHEGFTDAMAELWEPIPITQNSIGLKIKCINDSQSDCSTVNLCGTNVTLNKRKEHTFYVKDPDVTSVYTWHVYDLDNEAWLPYTYGRDRTITVDSDVEYRVHLRQDNFGIENNAYGVIEVSKIFSLTKYCCISDYETQPGDFQVSISQPSECLRRIDIENTNGSKINMFYWNIIGGTITFYNYEPNRSSILVKPDENFINYNFCGVSHEEQKIYQGSGNIVVTGENCADGPIIEIYPNPVGNYHSLVNVAIVDELYSKRSLRFRTAH